jgi:peptidoglycan/LPS O-acetylase OafA/YrhL
MENLSSGRFSTNSDFRNANVDALRLIAIFGVIAAHCNLATFGRWGVQLFFLITGFLIADLLGRTEKQFIIRRIFRLYPLYLCFLLTVLLFQLDFLVQPDINSLLVPINFILSIFMLSNIAPGVPFIAGSWSVSNELIFSFLILLRSKLLQYFWPIFALTIFLQLVLQAYALRLPEDLFIGKSSELYWNRVWFNTLNPIINLPFFLLGFGLKLNKFIFIKNKFIVLLFFFGIAVDIVVGHVISLWVLALYSLVCFIFSLRFNQIISKIFSFFGKRTYGIFLGHFLFLNLFNETIPNTLLGNFLETLVIFLLSTFVGSISWLLVEKPFLKLSSHFESKI